MRSIRCIIKNSRHLSSAYRFGVSYINAFYRDQRIAMFHIGRCGSTVLARMLHEHPQMYWPGEIFAPYVGKTGIKKGVSLAVNLINEFDRNKISKKFGFETKYLEQQHLSSNLINLSLGEYIELLKTLGFSKFIILHRKNYLRRAVSLEVGRKTKQWHNKENKSNPIMVKIDVDKFREGSEIKSLTQWFDIYDKRFKELQAKLLGEENLCMYYEEHILNDPHVGYSMVCQFCGIPRRHPEVSLVRTNPFRYSDVIKNFDEVRWTLSGTRYEWMLEDDDAFN